MDGSTGHLGRGGRIVANVALKSTIGRGLRRLGVLERVDVLLGHAEMLRHIGVRRRFRRDNPDFPLPPAAQAYDAYGVLDPESYRIHGIKHADYFASVIRRHIGQPRVLCEWGCGPMRVLRHMPAEFPGTTLVGLDYNPKTIAWCRANFPAIRFETNALAPPLPLADGEMDAIYSISVFTHLSERSHYQYAADLMRCLRPGGILVMTLHGDRFRRKMTPAEQTVFDRGDLVVRDGVNEGKRTFVAYQSQAFVRRLFGNWEILEHDPQPPLQGFMQETWVIRK